jgi:non-heme chloroperoxidase
LMIATSAFARISVEAQLAQETEMIKFIFKLILALLCAPGLLGQTAVKKDLWRDKSPHKEAFITINGVKLHYLDWGGKEGETLLFLTGFGHSAHIYDELAPRFTDRFYVLALTRRGHGQSDKPERGYDAQTLTEDVRLFLDHLNIKRVSLIGHSMAGKELTLFARLYPERVSRLVFLDAAYDYVGRSTILKDAPDETPPKNVLKSFNAFRRYFIKTKCGWSGAWEADMRHTIIFDNTPEGKPLRLEMPEKVSAELLRELEAENPDYTKIKAPTLSFYALGPFPKCSFPPDISGDALVKAQKFVSKFTEHLRQGVERFRRERPEARIVEIPNTDHWFFIQNQEQVVREIRRFLLKRNE